MNNDELIKYFWKQYNSCYKLEVENEIYLYYDINYIRKHKFSILLDNDIIYQPEPKNIGKLFFYITRTRLWIANEIWTIFEQNYSVDNSKISEFIINIISENNDLIEKIPGRMHF